MSVLKELVQYIYCTISVHLPNQQLDMETLLLVETLSFSIYNKRRRKLNKALKDLTLLSKFLFDETMDIPEAYEAVLRIVLSDEQIRLLTPSQSEKELRTMPWLRSIRLDVYALDEELTVYNTEMQAEFRKDLLKRSRYYQALIDSSLLEPGSVDFDQLNDSCIIVIAPFDLFGKGKYCYTFRSHCEEDRSIVLNDGAVRIFLNTRGKNDDEISRELRDFLHYVESADEELALRSGSENLKRLHACVKRIKSSEEIGVRYMQRWEEEIWTIQKSKMEDIISFLEELGEVPASLKEKIFDQRKTEVLRKWVKLAARSSTIAEFEENM